mmetsp:Transcript_8075/g.25644  ORF Transcript_8075/g.25644 Transcript_8075/m.25644 type:complete len:800 (+) Transcript_8075:49-2448(+)
MPQRSCLQCRWQWLGQVTAAVVALALTAHGILAIWMQRATGCDVLKNPLPLSDLHFHAEGMQLFGSPHGEMVASTALMVVTVGMGSLRVLVLLHKRAPPLWHACRTLLCKDLRSWLPGVLLHWLGLLSPQGPENPEVVRVRKMAEARHLLQARAIMSNSSLVAVAAVLYPTTSRLRGEISPSLYLYKEVVPILFVVAMSFLLIEVAGSVTRRGLDWGNLVMSCMWIWKYATTDSISRSSEYDEVWIIVCRIVQGLVLGNARLSIILTVMVSVAHMIIRVVLWGPDKAHFHRELVLVVAYSLLVWSFEQWQLAEAKAIVRAQMSDKSYALVSSVLSRMCDAVVELDSQLRLSQPCPRLSTLLLRQAPLACGMLFTDLMTPEDAQRVHGLLLAQGSSGCDGEDLSGAGSDTKEAGLGAGLAGLCHVRMNDGNSSKLSVELFYSCVPDIDGQPTYLVGIQEDREGGRQSPEAPAQDELAGPVEVLLGALPEGRRAEPARSVSARSASEASDAEEEAQHLWVDGGSDGLALLGCSPGFALLGGPGGACAALGDWLHLEDCRRVRAWLTSDRIGDTYCRVRFKVPGAAWSYECALSVDAMKEPPPSPSLGGRPMCLVLDGLQMKPKRRPRQYQSQYERRRKVAGCEGRQLGHAAARPARDVPFVVTISADSEDMEIGAASGFSRTTRLLFREYPSLRDWLDPPGKLWTALRGALREGVDGDGNNLGWFFFREPGSLTAEAAAVQVELLDTSGEVCTLGLSWLPPEARQGMLGGGGGDLGAGHGGSRAGSDAGAPAVEPQRRLAI